MNVAAVEAEKDIIQERRRQYDEAVRLLALAWGSGLFDDLDPPQLVGKFLSAPSFVRAIERRVADRAVEFLAGQYPEVQVSAKWKANGWVRDPDGERPRVTLNVRIRPRLRSHTGLRPVRK